MEMLGQNFLENDLLHINTCIPLMTLLSEKKFGTGSNYFYEANFLEDKNFLQKCRKLQTL